MKKLVLMLAVVFSVSLFSCGNGNSGSKSDTTDSAAASTEASVSAPAETPAGTPAPVDTPAVAE